jgi:hypothetical protein
MSGPNWSRWRQWLRDHHPWLLEIVKLIVWLITIVR